MVQALYIIVCIGLHMYIHYREVNMRKNAHSTLIQLDGINSIKQSRIIEDNYDRLKD